MVTRVQLDASHVSRCVTVWREKVPRYIRDSNKLLRYARSDYFFTLASLEYVERESLHGCLEFLSFLLVIGGSVADWASERDRPQRRRSVFCRFLRWIAVKDGG